jgi:hypothetical protein
MERFPISATARLDLTIQTGGAGITGQTPVAVIRRLTDNFYYDGALVGGSRFTATYATNAMTEVSSANLPGLYRYQFPHEEDLTSSEYFFVRLLNTGGNARIDDQTIAFGQLRTATAPELCALYGSVLDINGQPDINKNVRVSILPNTILTTGSKPGVSVDRIEMFTDSNGGFSIDLIRGLTIRLQIPSIGYDKKIAIPDASSVNFADL